MIWIPYNVPSSKNSKVKTSKGLFNSPVVSNYLRKLGIKSYSSRKKEVVLFKTTSLLFPVEELNTLFKDVDKPLIIGFHFVRDSKRKADFHNLVQLPLDLMTSFGIINDDNMDESFAVPLLIDNKFYSINKDFPGVYVDLILK